MIHYLFAYAQLLGDEMSRSVQWMHSGLCLLILMGCGHSSDLATSDAGQALDMSQGGTPGADMMAASAADMASLLADMVSMNRDMGPGAAEDMRSVPVPDMGAAAIDAGGTIEPDAEGMVDRGIPDMATEPLADRCAVIRASVVEAGFGNTVDIRCDETTAYLNADTYPDHTLMTGIMATNEQVPVPAPGFIAPIPLEPLGTDGQLSRDNALGVAVNGVPIYDYTSQGGLDPEAPYDRSRDVVVTGQLDICGGHAGRGDDYHYHTLPNCMVEMMPNRNDNPIIGWAYDGYPIYGFNTPDGRAIEAGDLDLCNGQADATFGYRYHASVEPPYILQCLRGAVDVQSLQVVRPMSRAPGSPRKPDGRPPRGGVDNLVFTENDAGQRSMTYSYNGSDYFMNYRPIGDENCFEFTMNTVTFGQLEGVYCRD